MVVLFYQYFKYRFVSTLESIFEILVYYNTVNTEIKVIPRRAYLSFNILM